MKLKIVEPGWAGFTGNFGGVEFVDGVSEREVTQNEGFKLANLIRIETLDGLNPSSSQQNLDSKCIPAYVGMDNPPAPPAPAPVVWTKEALQEIADREGIKGVRKIAAEFDVKSTSITVLIDAILAKQVKPEVAPPAAPVEGEGSAAEAVVGSSVQPSTFEFAPGVTAELGEIVLAALAKSGLTPQEWNAQAPELREEAIAAEVALRQA